ncbi:MAG TPA: hypothetical protein VEZ20_12460 [Allosphingosinicella sp.]|nr:hypothetical protein [Allosphingosinicella sp.]
MKRLFLLAAAAAAVSILAAPAAALAQKPGGEALPGVEQEEARPEDMLGALRGAVSTMRESMYGPGPAVAGWNVGGADPDSRARAAGAETHWLHLSGGDDGPSVVMLTREGIADFAPAGWRIADSYGTGAAALDNPFVQFGRLTPRYVFAVRAASRRVGAADCSDPVSHAILYEVPGAPESPEDEDMLLFFRIAILAGEDQVVCTRYDPDGAAFRLRAFLPDGRSLPQLDDEGERLRVVPAGPLEALLRVPDRPANPG